MTRWPSTFQLSSPISSTRPINSTSSAETESTISAGVKLVKDDSKSAQRWAKEQLSLGGTYHWDGEVARPYLAFTLGGTHIRTSAAESASDTFFSGSIGLGLKFLPTSRFGIRVEARAYGTVLDSGTDLFCSTGPDANVCAIRVEGEMLSQVETFVGVTFRF